MAVEALAALLLIYIIYNTHARHARHDMPRVLVVQCICISKLCLSTNLDVDLVLIGLLYKIRKDTAVVIDLICN